VKKGFNENMIKLIEITNDNMFHECIGLKVTDEQDRFVASNIYSLAQAWLYSKIARPFCIYNDDVMVGFVMLGYDESEKKCEIWRFMIDAKHQNKGYGKEAMRVVLEYIKSNPVFSKIYLTVNPDNDVAVKLYESFGFFATGEMVYDEIVMVLKQGGKHGTE